MLFPDNIYIVMEYLSGGSLIDFLRKRTAQGVTVKQKKKGNEVPKRLPPKVTSRDLFQFAIDVARGMEYLADHDVSWTVMQRSLWIVIILWDLLISAECTADLQ